jgi:hypothetical protein
MKVVGYAYPWDAAEPGFVERVSAAGIDEVAVATSYHSTRAATPWSTTSSAVHAAHAALYRPQRDEAWRGRTLRPGAPSWVSDPDPAGTAIARLREAGLPASAWVVLTHDSRLGAQHPDVTVRNCFDESYPWALCPSRPAVREHAAALTAESVRGLDVSTVVLEACGQLGVVHQCQHEKTDGAWSPAVVQLLSVCCCDACADAWQTPRDTVVRSLREAVIERLAEAASGASQTGLPDELETELLLGRQAATDALRAEVLATLGEQAVALHASLDPWVTGALPGLTPAAGDEVDSVVLPCWQPGEASVATAREARVSLPDDTAIGSYVTVTAAQPLPDPAGYVRALGDAGVTELHLYHLGLAGPARWPDLAAAAAAAHQTSDISQSPDGGPTAA